MEINKKTRNQSFDQVAGICIIFMIFTHICQLSYQTGWPVYMKSLGIFYFYMYFFFMKSGMFFHEKSIKDCILNNARHLLVPYFLYMLIGHIVHCINIYVKEGFLPLSSIFIQPWQEIYSWGSSIGNLPLWFLLCLFLVKISYNIIVKLHVNPIVILLISFAGAVYLQFSDMIIKGYQVPYTIGAFLMAMSIYSFAFFMRKLIDVGGQIWTYILGVIFLISIYIGSPGVDIRSNNCSSFCLPWFLFSFLACMFLLRLFAIKPFAMAWLGNVGRNSMTYYVWHWILLNLVSILYYILGGESNKILWGLMVLCCIVFLPLIQHIKTKITSKK